MFFHKIRIISSCISFFTLSNITIYSHPYSQFKIDRYPMILFPRGLEISCCFQFSVIKDRMIITLSFLWMFMCACLTCSSGWGGHVNMCFGTCGSKKTASGILLSKAALLLHNVSHWSGVQHLVYPGWKANPRI